MKPVPTWTSPPDSLVQYRTEHAADVAAPGTQAKVVWDRFRNTLAYKDAILSLIDVQQGLCAYCEQTLVWTAKELQAAGRKGRTPGNAGDRVELDSQIEHAESKAGGPGRALDPGNLIACCAGGTAIHLADFSPERHAAKSRAQPGECCGQRKGDGPSAFDPRSLPVSRSLVHFDVEGRIRPSPKGCAAAGLSEAVVDATINATLNLNCARLMNARQARYRDAQETFELLKWAAEKAELPALQVQLLETAVAEIMAPQQNARLRPFWSVWRQVFEPFSTQWIEANLASLNLSPAAL